MPTLALTVIVAVLVAVAGASELAWGAVDLEAFINPYAESSPFKVRYYDQIEYVYGEGSLLHHHLGGKQWVVEGTTSGGQDVQDLADMLNRKIASDGSSAKVSGLEVSYEFKMDPTARGSSMEYAVEINGNMTGYELDLQSRWPWVGFDWRGLTITDDVVVDGMPINIPASLLRETEPEAYGLLAGTEADRILLRPLMDAEPILQQSIHAWNYTYYYIRDRPDVRLPWHADEITSGFTELTLTGVMKEDNPANPVAVVLDETYAVLAGEMGSHARIKIMGFGNPNIWEGVEIFEVYREVPEVGECFGFWECASLGNRFVIGAILSAPAVATGTGLFLVCKWLFKRRNTYRRDAIH